MKINRNFSFVFILLAVAQMVICNYFKISPYIYITILPAMILCLPPKMNTALTMLTAFATGLAVDVLSEGLAGINALALVPVALVKRPILHLVLGTDLTAKEEPFNIRTTGMRKILTASAAAYAVFLAVYIMADGAGIRPFWFNLSRFAASLVCDCLLSLLVVHVLNPNDR